MAARHIDQVPRWAGVFAIAVGVVVLVGWTFGIESLKGAGHRITMKPNAAIGLITCGVALVALRHRRPWSLRVAGYSAALAVTIGLLTLAEHLTGWDLLLDQLLFEEPPGAPATFRPGRMGPNASTSLALAGIALISTTLPSERAARLAQAFALGVATLATIAMVGYAYGAQQLYSIAQYTAIAWPTALTFLVIAIGILALRPEVGGVAVLLSEGPGGLMARRVMTPAILVPLALGYLRVHGQERGLYDTGLGTALLVVSVIAILAATIWVTAIRIDQTNRERERAMVERDRLLVSERAAREQAEHASRLKDEFLAALSHELRTPLNAILGWTEMLRSDTVPAEQRARAAEVVSRNGGMLVRLIEDILDVSRSAGGRLHLQVEPLDVIPVAAAAVEVMAPEAAAKGIRIESRLDGLHATVSGDRHRLQQVVVNLVSNAVKFTPPGGTITVSADLRPGSVDLRVSDDGHGIDPEFLPHLFERFRQEDGTTTREHGGLGLGLSIVRELAVLHGGTVRAHSAGRGQGSTFTVTLPLFGSHVGKR